MGVLAPHDRVFSRSPSPLRTLVSSEYSNKHHHHQKAAAEARLKKIQHFQQATTDLCGELSQQALNTFRPERPGRGASSRIVLHGGVDRIRVVRI